ncbi:3-dehydroquinate dehydratase [Ancylobacter defluvii]|nr:type II 3-dehydroquinate dehydratase [Ancylobacter defluvii]MBS7589444.1 3-dehydroquinate dehydratase [Ancylobacter defluvii]
MLVTALRIDVVNGPNANLYGLDPSGPYGSLTLADIGARCEAKAAGFGATLRFRQSNHEGVLIDWIQAARTEADGVIINAASLSYGSIGLLDALSALGKPAFQVHVSNVFKREKLRHFSPLSAAVTGCIIGAGPMGYELAIEALVAQLRGEV